MLDKPKTTKTLGQVELAKKKNSKWDGRWMNHNGVTNIKIKFGIHVIAHKIYSSIQLDNIPCEALDLAFKMVKINISIDPAELQMSQMRKNMESI